MFHLQADGCPGFGRDMVRRLRRRSAPALCFFGRTMSRMPADICSALGPLCLCEELPALWRPGAVPGILPLWRENPMGYLGRLQGGEAEDRVRRGTRFDLGSHAKPFRDCHARHGFRAFAENVHHVQPRGHGSVILFLLLQGLVVFVLGAWCLISGTSRMSGAIVLLRAHRNVPEPYLDRASESLGGTSL
jgi:hypothetical protein